MGQQQDILDFEVTSNVPPPGKPPDPDGTSTPVTTKETADSATADDVLSSESPTSEEPARDEHGKFRRRHRARSQEAGPDDVPRIQALTKKNRELQEQLDKLKTPTPQTGAAIPSPTQPQSQQPMAAAVVAGNGATPGSQSSPQQAPSQAPQRPPGIPTTFPDWTAWQALDGNFGKTFEEYSDARSDWRWLVNDQQRRQFDAMQSAMQTRQSRLDNYEKSKVDARTKYADFDAALQAAPNISAVMVEALLASDKPSEIAYHLATHPDVAAQLAQETFNHPPTAYEPMKRLLESYLVASATPSPSTAQHAADKKTGSALALVPPPAAPKPPNPVRTQAPVSADSDLPGDDASLEDHERAFHKGGRRHR